MPMFDDPQKELRRLEEELLAEETQWVDDDLSDLDALLADYEEEFEEEVEEDYRQIDDLRAMSDILLEEEEDSDRMLYRDNVKKAKKQKQKGVTGLIVIACLESVAIVGLLAWWFLCLR